MIILRSVILLLVRAAIKISARGEDTMLGNDDPDHRRHLQQPAAAEDEEEPVFDILTGEQIMPSTTTTSTNTNESTAVPAPTPTFLQDGIISGTVYNDVNGNGQRDQASSSSSSQEESPVSDVNVDLFNCDTGALEGFTTTNNDGYYSLSISGKNLPEEDAITSKNCYYIQFTVLDTDNNDDSDEATVLFTTPQNGETSDIFLGRGESILNVDAGIIQESLGGGALLPQDTFTEWNTYFPTFAPSTSTGTEDEAGAETTSSSSNNTISPTPSPMYEEMTTEEVDDQGTISTTTLSEVEDTETATEKDEGAAAATTTTTDEQENENMINLRSSVRLQLSNVDTRMKRDALSLFESVCATFLNAQFENGSTAVPSLYDLNCNVLRQEIGQQERARERRSLRLGRFLVETTDTANDSNSISSSSLIIRVRVIGHTDKTSSVQEAADVKFRDMLVKSFNDRGSQFSDALKEESALLMASSSTESSSETAKYFETVGTITSVVTSEVNGNGSASGVQNSSEGNNDNDGGANKGIVAAIAVCIVIGCVIWVGLFTLMKRRRREQSNQSTESNAGTAGDTSNVVGIGSDSSRSSGGRMAIFKSFPTSSLVPRFNTDSPPCTPPSNITAASSYSPNSMCSYVGSDGEVEMIEDGLEAHPNAPVRRDVVAPPGKLGILVSGSASTIGYGPAVRTIQPGSPMEGLIHVEDRIVAINDVDTREFSAEEIIQVMADTSGSERKITVLSDQP